MHERFKSWSEVNTLHILPTDTAVVQDRAGLCDLSVREERKKNRLWMDVTIQVFLCAVSTSKKVQLHWPAQRSCDKINDITHFRPLNTVQITEWCWRRCSKTEESEQQQEQQQQQQQILQMVAHVPSWKMVVPHSYQHQGSLSFLHHCSQLNCFNSRMSYSYELSWDYELRIIQLLFHQSSLWPLLFIQNTQISLLRECRTTALQFRSTKYEWRVL